MTKKSKSSLPAGKYTPTRGSNYGMDGFDFDFQYNDGVLDAAIHPSVKGMSELPNDLIVGPKTSELPSDIDMTREAGNLYGMGDVLSDNIVDLSWLEVDHQDMDRLPRNPVDLAIPELAEAWGRTNEKSRYHLSQNHKDLEEVKYRESLEEQPRNNVLSKNEKKQILRRALRRASNGEPLKEVIKKARLEAHPNEEDVRSVLAHIEREYGLLGNVYLHADAYPKCASGRWDQKLKKQAKSANFMVKSSKCGSCVMAQRGHCQIFKKELVDSVDWKKAARLNIPRLKALNKKVASTGDLKNDLRSAFLAKSESTRKATDHHIQPHIVDSVTEQEAFDFIKGATPVYKKLVASRLDINKQKRNAIKRLKKYKKAGLIDERSFNKLMQSSASPRAILSAVDEIKFINKKASVYGSLDDSQHQQMTMVWRKLDNNAKEVVAAQKKLDKRIEEQANVSLHKLVKASLLTKKEAGVISRLKLSSEHKLMLANQLIQKRDLARKRVTSSGDTAQYKGYGENGMFISKEDETESVRHFSTQGRKANKDQEKVKEATIFAKRMAKKGWHGVLLQELVAETFGAKIAKLASKDIKKVSSTTSESFVSDSYNAPIHSEIQGIEFSEHNNELDNIQFNKQAEEQPELEINMDGFILEF